MSSQQLWKRRSSSCSSAVCTARPSSPSRSLRSRPSLWSLYVVEYRVRLLEKIVDKDNKLGTKFVNALLNNEAVRSFTQETHEVDQYDTILGQIEKLSVADVQTISRLNAGQALIFSTGLGLMLTISARRLLGLAGGPVLTIGDVVAIHAMMLQLHQPLTSSGSHIRSSANRSQLRSSFYYSSSAHQKSRRFRTRPSWTCPSARSNSRTCRLGTRNGGSLSARARYGTSRLRSPLARRRRSSAAAGWQEHCTQADHARIRSAARARFNRRPGHQRRLLAIIARQVGPCAAGHCSIRRECDVQLEVWRLVCGYGEGGGDRGKGRPRSDGG